MHRQSDSSSSRSGAWRRQWALAALVTAHVAGCGGSPSATMQKEPPPDDGELLPSSLVINEIVSSNQGSYADEFGESPDWIELYNGGSEPINLKGYSLSDSTANPRRWVFGDVTIDAGQYLVVAASGRDIRAFERVAPAEFRGLTSFVWDWADNKYDPPGGSYVAPGLFPGQIFGTEGGRIVISAKLYLADNTGGIGWNAALIHQGWNGWEETSFADFSAHNRAYLEATLPAGKAFELHLCQTGASCSDGYVLALTGNGIPNYHYAVPIVGKVEGLDLSKLNGFELRPVTTGLETQILISDFGFSHSGYFLHTNFSLAKSGETLVLSNAASEIIDRRAVPLLKADVAYGRSSAIEGQWVVFAQPTPGAPNSGDEYQGVCKPPVWSQASGLYDSPLTASAPAVGDCQIFYTTDGTKPTRDSMPLAGELTVDQTMVVQSTAAGSGWLESEVTTHSYFVGDRHELAVVSIATEPSLLFDPVTGIYELGPAASPELPYKGANFWKDVEIPAHLQFFEPGGKLGFESGVGLAIFGNYSRANPMKSLAVAFRGEYGLSTLAYPLFPDRPELTTFDNFVLRNSGNDFGKTMFRDALGSSLCDTMGLDYQAYRPTVVYINGRYWGIHNLREKVNADYFLTHYGLRDTDFDLLRPGESAQVGTPNDWKTLTAQIESNGADTAEKYAAVAAQIDIDDFIDFNCAEIYDGNKDWPGNNVKWWKTHLATGRWRWVIYDMDAGFQDPQVNILKQATTVNTSWPNPAWSTLVLRRLLENGEFRARFIARCALRIATNFETTRVVGRIDAMAERIRSEIPRFFTRWSLDPASWNVQVERLRSFARQRPDILRQQFAEFFQLPGTVKLSIAPGLGTVAIDGVKFSDTSVTLTVFAGSPISIEAVAPVGKSFVRYSDGYTEASRSLTLTADSELGLTFE